MKRWVFTLAVGIALAGCGDRTPPAPATSKSPASEAPAEDTSVMRGKTSLYLYDTDPSTGAAGKPRIEIRDAEVTVEQREGKEVWTFDNAHAVLYDDEGEETHLQAAKGWLDEANNRASLSGGVTMEMGTKSVALEDVELWAEEPTDPTAPDAKAVWRARSDKPVTLRDGDSFVQATGLEYDVNTKNLLLKDVEGILDFEPAPAPDTDTTETGEDAPPVADTGASLPEGSAQ